jgi:hypothetical protein
VNTSLLRFAPIKFGSLSALFVLVSGINLFGLITPGTAAVEGLGRSVAPKAQTSQPATALSNFNRPLQNGTYLFSDAVAPNQTQGTYFVFQVHNQQVVGALYTPGSSFDCFYGTQAPGNLDVKVMDSYESTTYRQSVTLTDYYRLTQLSSNDQRLLQSCRATVPAPAQLRATSP